MTIHELSLTALQEQLTEVVTATVLELAEKLKRALAGEMVYEATRSTSTGHAAPTP
jgi:hypothetical protein